jgi:hypothetical protein
MVGIMSRGYLSRIGMLIEILRSPDARNLAPTRTLACHRDESHLPEIVV